MAALPQQGAAPLAPLRGYTYTYTVEVPYMLKTVEQMSKISGIGENKLRELMDSGELEYIQNGKQRFTRGYKRYKETSGLTEWKIGHIFHSIFT